MGAELKKRVQDVDSHLKVQLLRGGYSFPPPIPNESLFRPIVDRKGDNV